jgi:ABC-type amino acid transport substrate-binding protein
MKRTILPTIWLCLIRSYLVCLYLVWACATSLEAAAAESASPPLDEFEYYTEEYPPYNFIEENKIKGISVDLLKAAAQLLNIQIPENAIKLRPWARSYRTVKATKNTVLFSAARTKQREALFRWAGPIGRAHVVLIGMKKKQMRIENPEQLKHYTIGVIIDDVAEQLVRKQGVPAGKIQYAYSTIALARMLEYERIDLIAYTERSALWSIYKAGYDPGNYEVVYELDHVDLYYAFHKATPPEHVQAFQWALDQLKQKTHADHISDYDAIIKKYQKPETD